VGLIPYYADDLVTIYHGDCREWQGSADVLITDPPYGVDFIGKATKHTAADGGYTTDDDAAIGPEVISGLLPLVKRAAVFPGIRQMFRYPEPWDVGCVYCPSGAGRGRWGWTMFNPVLFYGKRPTNGSYPASITSFATADDLADGHPCPKPMRWMTWLVGLASLPGETVLDPFAGSGTTLMAAKDLGRHAIGIEIEERYCEIAATRCSQEVLGLAL
jgi:site-specific DNA-methyltransferase (adenine-specific)